MKHVRCSSAIGHLLVIVLCAAMSARVQASPCSADCARRMAACRVERCAALPSALCRDQCRAITGCRAGGARIRTLATVVSECLQGDRRWAGRQRLEIKRGDCPVTIVSPIASDTVRVTNPDCNCEVYGAYRDGASAVRSAAFQRLGVSPDGRTVLFELNTHVADPSCHGPTYDRTEGIFAVGPDDQVRWLGPPSQEKAYQLVPTMAGPPIVTTYRLYFSFSPNGRFVAFSDRGPGADGNEAAQIVVMRLPQGERTQVTHFIASHQGNPTGPDVYALFLDDETLGLYGYGQGGSDYFTVRPDGTNLRPIEVPDFGTGGGTIMTAFQIAGTLGTTIAAQFGDIEATEPIPGKAQELLLYAGPHRFLQLTRFLRSDTQAGPSMNTGDRVFFLASENRHDMNPMNPMNACQLFSIDRLGGDLRQVTRFASPARSTIGCLGGSADPREWRVAQTAPPQFDPSARTLVFDVTGDPYGLHPVGLQVFAARRDGSGIRQLTNYRGMEGSAADGTLSVELPGPIATSGSAN